MTIDKPRRPAIGVGGVVWKGDEVLLIQRGKEPNRGHWSLPGGHQEWGETVRQAVAREVREETGVEVEVDHLIDVVDAIIAAAGEPAEYHFTLIDYRCDWVSGDAVAGDDASDVAWVKQGDLGKFNLWDETLRIIEVSRNLLP